MVAVANAIKQSDAIVITGNRLAVDDAGARAQAGQRLDDERKAVRQIIARAVASASISSSIVPTARAVAI